MIITLLLSSFRLFRLFRFSDFFRRLILYFSDACHFTLMPRCADAAMLRR